jgi:hypothetical protein
MATTLHDRTMEVVATQRIEVPDLSAQMRRLMQDMTELDKATKTAREFMLEWRRAEKAQSQTVMAAIPFKRMHNLTMVLARRMSALAVRMTSELGPLARMFASGLAAPITLGLSTALLAGSAMVALGRWIFDKMVELGDKMMDDHRTVMATGATLGGLRAFGTEYQGLLNDPQDLVRNIATGMADWGSKQAIALRALGIKKGPDAATTAVAVVAATAAFLKTLPAGNWMKLAETYGLTALFSPEELIRLRRVSQQELEEHAKAYEAHKADMRVTEKAQKGLIEFALAIHSFWGTAEAVIANRLGETGITDDVNQLSQTILKLVKDFATHSPFIDDLIKKFKKWLEWFVGELENGDVRKWINKTAATLAEYTTTVKSWLKDVDALYQIFKWFWERLDKIAAFLQAPVSTIEKELTDPASREKIRREMGDKPLPTGKELDDAAKWWGVDKKGREKIARDFGDKTFPGKELDDAAKWWGVDKASRDKAAKDFGDKPLPRGKELDDAAKWWGVDPAAREKAAQAFGDRPLGESLALSKPRKERDEAGALPDEELGQGAINPKKLKVINKSDQDVTWDTSSMAGVSF